VLMETTGRLPLQLAVSLEMEEATFLISSCLLVVAWTGLWYGCSWWIVKHPPSWPPSSIEAENSPHWFACCISSTTNAVISVAVCLPAVWSLIDQPVELKFVSSSAVGMCLCPPTDPICAPMVLSQGWAPTMALVALAGQSFAIRTAVDLVLQARHGMLEWDGAVHHGIFVMAGWLIRRHCMMPFNAAVLMLMELSTPFLNYYLFFRSRYPYASSVNSAKSLFCFTFFVVRILINSYGAFLFVQEYPSALPQKVPKWQQQLMLTVVVASVLLQWFWGSRLLLKYFTKRTKTVTTKLE